jgi:hypothetical protein
MIYTFAAEDKFFIICSLSLTLVDQALIFQRAGGGSATLGYGLGS